MIIIEAVGKDFHIRGRNKDGTRYVKEVNDFKPYFYVQNTGGEFRSLYGDPLRKVVVDHPAKVRAERDNFEKTYEADVTYINRFLIDRYKTIPQEPIRFCMLDIEVETTEGFPSVTKADKMITSVACFDSMKKTFYVFSVGRDRPEKSRYTYKGYPVIEFGHVDEISMLTRCIDFFTDFDHDLIFAWNGDGFDFPYIVNRLNGLKMDSRRLSPINQIDDKSKKPRGRIWLDLMRAYRKLSTHELESYSLDYVGKEEVGEGKLAYEGSLSDLYHTDYEKYIQYNIHDVWLMVEIEKRKGIIAYFDTVRRLTFSSWYDVFFNSRVLDFYFLKKAKEYGVCLPTKKRKDDTYIPVKGARVIEPRTGISERIAVGDVRSLYPTAILTCNMSPETRLIFDEHNIDQDIPYVKVGETFFRTDVRGFVPKVVEDVWDFRQQLKSEMKKYPIGSPEHEMYDNLQTVAKFLLNSIYGVMLAPHFRLFTKEVGAAVTFFGRETNMWMEAKIKEMGSDVIAGDTDSVFFTLEAENLSDMAFEGTEIMEYVNSTLNKFCEEKFGSSQYNKMFIEFEKIYSRVLFLKAQDGKAIKKRYAGLIVWKEGKHLDNEPILDIKGFETRRSDTPFRFRGLQKEVLNMILIVKANPDETKELIVSILKEEKQKILQGNHNLEDIAIPKGMSKSIEEYTSNIPIHIAGALYYNKFFDGHIKQEKIKYLYVNGVPKGLPYTHVISFPDKCPDGFEINYSKMAELLIDDKFDSIFYSLGWNIDEINPKKESLEKWL